MDIVEKLQSIQEEYKNDYVVVHKADDGYVEIWTKDETKLIHSMLGTKKVAFRVASHLALNQIRQERKLVAWFNVDGSKRGYQTQKNNGGI